jgi:hypothetical protein
MRAGCKTNFRWWNDLLTPALSSEEREKWLPRLWKYKYLEIVQMRKQCLPPPRAWERARMRARGHRVLPAALILLQIQPLRDKASGELKIMPV